MNRLLVMACLLVGCGTDAVPDTGTSAGAPADHATGGIASAAASGGTTSTSGTGEAGTGLLGGASQAGTTASANAGTAGGGAAGPGGASTGGLGGAGGNATAGGASNASGGGAVVVDPALLPKVTLHLAGDSTVMTYAADSAQEGWGQELLQYFNAKLSLDNQAQGGASVETFYTGRWKTILSALHAGDYVMAAFGANDSGTVAGRHVDPPDFQARFAVMADEVKAKQATFIIVTPSALQEWTSGKEGNNRLGPYVTVLQALADTETLTLVDLNARSIELLNMVGQTAAKDIYIDGDKAHFTKLGATKMAELVASDLVRTGSPLAAYRK